MTGSIDQLIHEYARRYSARDAEGVSELCQAPFLAIRSGRRIDMPDREAVRAHFSSMIDTYREGGAATWSPVETDVHELGDASAFATVRWNARDAEGQVIRDTRTTYHLLKDPDGWTILSYTNHF